MVATTAVHGWSKWTFSQFTHKATISGIARTADVDENRFAGSLTELQAFSSAFVAARTTRASGAPLESRDEQTTSGLYSPCA